MSKKGTFVISLDFELHWGSIETKTVLDNQAQQYFLNTRNVIPQMLNLFKENNIHATWAIVGMLFNRNPKEWYDRLPATIPSYNNDKVSGYDWVNKNGFLKDDDLFHFAPELIQKIKSTSNQEVGTHTYSHYFCLEEGQTIQQFRNDLKCANELANEAGIVLHSLIFPRNQYNDAYMSVCQEFGISAVRTCPNIWYWSPTAQSGLFRKIFRTGDAYVKMQPIKPVFLNDIKADRLPVQLPASRLYRPWSKKFSVFNKMKIKRILNEMTSAAETGAYYHLWWHPENLGTFPDQCMGELEHIIKHYQFLKKEFGFESYTMKEVADLVLMK